MLKNIHKSLINISHSKLFNTFFAWVAMIMIMFFIASTELKGVVGEEYYYIINITTAILFIIEYVIRLAGSLHPLKEARKAIMILDLLVIITLFASYQTAYLKSFRVMRLISIFRKKRYKIALVTIRHVWLSHKEEMIATSMFFIILIFISANLMHVIEGNIQDGFASIPRAAYWAIITATSVGYGDVVPLTPLGKVVASITSTIGFLTYTMVTVIFATGFSKEWSRVREIYEDKDR